MIRCLMGVRVVGLPAGPPPPSPPQPAHAIARISHAAKIPLAWRMVAIQVFPTAGRNRAKRLIGRPLPDDESALYITRFLFTTETLRHGENRPDSSRFWAPDTD